jgi:23S rRNA pseudouridine1911/1915/1917 synthase
MPRQALHARSLGFVHPVTGKELFFEAPLPADFTGVLEKWRGYSKHVIEKNEAE